MTDRGHVQLSFSNLSDGFLFAFFSTETGFDFLALGSLLKMCAQTDHRRRHGNGNPNTRGTVDNESVSFSRKIKTVITNLCLKVKQGKSIGYFL